MVRWSPPTHISPTGRSPARWSASTGFTATSTGYVGTSDGWTDLADDRLDTTYATAGPGNVAQTGQVPVSGVEDTFTLALGFGADAAEAIATARCEPRHGLRRDRSGVPA